MAQILVVAAKGRRVRNPGHPKVRPIVGAVTVDPNNPFWARRLAFGDVIETTPEKEAERQRVEADREAAEAAQKKLAADEAAPAHAEQ
jgi:hypothetical protein